MESRVVPAISVTICRSSPIKALIREDFPAFGPSYNRDTGQLLLQYLHLLLGHGRHILSSKSPV